MVAEAWAASDGLTAWRTGFTPMQSLTIDPDLGGNGTLKFAFVNGWRSVRTPFPEGPPRGTIRYAGGATQEVALVDAATALDLAMPRSPMPCRAIPSPTPSPTQAPTGAPTKTFPVPTVPPMPAPDQPGATNGDSVTSTQAPPCDTVVITRARLTTAAIVTSRGTAQTPAWEFTIEGARTPLVRVAVSPSDVTRQPMVEVPPLPANAGIASAQSVDRASGKSLSFTLGVGACDRDVKGRAYETADLVIVGGTYTSPSPNMACPAMLKLQPVTVELAALLGQRLVVDAATGQPVGAPPA